MNKEIKISVDSDVYDKFKVACAALSGDTEERAFEVCMRWYISKAFGEAAKTFEKVSREYSLETGTEQTVNAVKSSSTENNNFYYGKAINKIHKWASRPDQYNHRIIKAYFTAVDTVGSATINMMESLCSNKEHHPELFVPTFKSNYAQMKIDNSNSHGKVFEDNGSDVWIWDKVEQELMKYKKYFYGGKVN